MFEWKQFLDTKTQINTLFDSADIDCLLCFQNYNVDINRLNIIKQHFSLNPQNIPHSNFIRARKTKSSLIQWQIKPSGFSPKTVLWIFLLWYLFLQKIL